MADAAPTATDLDLALSSGRVRAWVHGPREGPLVVGLPGITANSRSFAALAPRLAARGMRVAALDLRGRGHSEETGRGTYGWEAHAADVVEAVAALGELRFDLVGHSMGAFVALQVASTRPPGLHELVLVDAVGTPDPDALVPVAASIARLESSWPSAEAYVAAVRDAGHVTPWSEMWEAAYRYELEDLPGGGVAPRTSLAAVAEDSAWGGAHRARDLWAAVAVPALLLRAAVPFGAEGGGIAPAAEAAAFADAVPGARVVEVDANHYGVMADETALRAIEDFLSRAA